LSSWATVSFSRRSLLPKVRNTRSGPGSAVLCRHPHCDVGVLLDLAQRTTEPRATLLIMVTQSRKMGKADYSTPSGAEEQNTWSFTSTSTLFGLMACYCAQLQFYEYPTFCIFKTSSSLQRLLLFTYVTESRNCHASLQPADRELLVAYLGN
jgi:hypothetical protein